MSDASPSLDTLRALEVTGVWLAAVATFTAAYVALRIARRQDEVRLTASVVDGLRFDGLGGRKEEVVWITVTNIARRPVTVNAVGWRFSRFVRKALYQNIDPPNRELPWRMSDGEQVTLVIPVARPNRENWYESLADAFGEFSRPRAWYELKCFRFEVATTTGETFRFKPNADFLGRVASAVQRLRMNEA